MVTKKIKKIINFISKNLVGVGGQRDPKGSGQPEIGYFQNSITTDQYVLRFHVSMEHSSNMAKSNRL
jgi:hypothetical protein